MGDNFEIVADVEATEDEAPQLAAATVGWLIGSGIVDAHPTDCVLGAPTGYPPGPRYQDAVTAPDDITLQLRTNGVEVTVGRTVFHPIQGETGPVECPACGEIVILEDAHTGKMTPHWQPFDEALGTWYAGGSAAVVCPHCSHAAHLNDWHWLGDWPFAVGFLGFTFWNWPPLNPDFVTTLADQLGHRVVVTRGKL